MPHWPLQCFSELLDQQRSKGPYEHITQTTQNPATISHSHSSIYSPAAPDDNTTYLAHTLPIPRQLRHDILHIRLLLLLARLLSTILVISSNLPLPLSWLRCSHRCRRTPLQQRSKCRIGKERLICVRSVLALSLWRWWSERRRGRGCRGWERRRLSSTRACTSEEACEIC